MAHTWKRNYLGIFQADCLVPAWRHHKKFQSRIHRRSERRKQGKILAEHMRDAYYEGNYVQQMYDEIAQREDLEREDREDYEAHMRGDYDYDDYHDDCDYDYEYAYDIIYPRYERSTIRRCHHCGAVIIDESKV